MQQQQQQRFQHPNLPLLASYTNNDSRDALERGRKETLVVIQPSLTNSNGHETHTQSINRVNIHPKASPVLSPDSVARNARTSAHASTSSNADGDAADRAYREKLNMFNKLKQLTNSGCSSQQASPPPPASAVSVSVTSPTSESRGHTSGNNFVMPPRSNHSAQQQHIYRGDSSPPPSESPPRSSDDDDDEAVYVRVPQQQQQPRVPSSSRPPPVTVVTAPFSSTTSPPPPSSRASSRGRHTPSRSQSHHMQQQPQSHQQHGSRSQSQSHLSSNPAVTVVLPHQQQQQPPRRSVSSSSSGSNVETLKDILSRNKQRIERRHSSRSGSSNGGNITAHQNHEVEQLRQQIAKMKAETQRLQSELHLSNTHNNSNSNINANSDNSHYHHHTATSYHQPPPPPPIYPHSHHHHHHHHHHFQHNTTDNSFRLLRDLYANNESSQNHHHENSSASTAHHARRHGQLSADADENSDVQHVGDLLRQYTHPRGAEHSNNTNNRISSPHQSPTKSHDHSQHLRHMGGANGNASFANESAPAHAHPAPHHDSSGSHHPAPFSSNIALQQLHGEWADQERELRYYTELIAEIKSRHLQPTEAAIKAAKDRLKGELIAEKAAMDEKKILLTKALTQLSSESPAMLSPDAPHHPETSATVGSTAIVVSEHTQKPPPYTPLSASHSFRPDDAQQQQQQHLVQSSYQLSGPRETVHSVPVFDHAPPQQQLPRPAPQSNYSPLNSQYFHTSPPVTTRNAGSRPNSSAGYVANVDQSLLLHDNPNTSNLMEQSVDYYKQRLAAMQARTNHM